MKKKLDINKDIKVIELDPGKQYALIFPDWIGAKGFKQAVESLKAIGVDKFIAVHSASGATMQELKNIK